MFQRQLISFQKVKRVMIDFYQLPTITFEGDVLKCPIFHLSYTHLKLPVQTWTSKLGWMDHFVLF